MDNQFKLRLVCPICHINLKDMDGKLHCNHCGVFFNKNQFKYYEFILDDKLYIIDTTSEEYVTRQESRSINFYQEFLKPLILQEPCESLLEVGCGIGKLISLLREDGYEAYGVDLPNLSPYWSRLINNSQYFYCCDATSLPFADESFDMIFSLGVIEHIGTAIGHCTLRDDYQDKRRQFAQEILRVVKPGGRILISCPNKSFPIDFQHGVTDDRSLDSLSINLRDFIHKATKLNFHATWGKNHLLSYPEVRKLFGERRHYSALPLKGFFGFSRYKSGFYGPFVKIVRLCLENLPQIMRSSFFNPYMLIEIQK